MKIKSITDIITNSSTEVFVFNTNEKDIVNNYVSNIKGVNIPELLEKDSVLYKELINRRYLFNTINEYLLDYLIEGPLIKELQKKFITYVKNLDIDKEDINDVISTLDIRDSIGVLFAWKYRNFVINFIKEYYKDFPDELKNIPNELNINNYLGKYYVSSIDDNTISYNDIEYLEQFGLRVHLG